MTQTSISRRVEDSIRSLSVRDYEGAFIHLFPAVDKTAKKRRPSQGVGSRIKSFIADEETLITGIAMNNVIKMSVDGIDFPTAMYKFGRTSIAHEGELDERLKINETGSLQVGHVWNLPSSYLTGMISSVILSPENKNEMISDNNLRLSLFGESYVVNELWGKLPLIQDKMCKKWEREDLFKLSSVNG